MKCLCLLLLVVILLVAATVIQNVIYLRQLVGEESGITSANLLPERKENVHILVALQQEISKSIFQATYGDQCNISNYPVVFERGSFGKVNFFKESYGLLVIRPTVQEMDAYYIQKKTYSYANHDLKFGARNKVDGSRIWLNSKKNSQFSLPTEHIRRLKPLCMKITKKVTESPQILYEQYKVAALVSRNSYLIVLQQGLVFDRGNVALSCGIFQQLNSCVNAFYKQNVKKWTQLNRGLTAFRTNWADLFIQRHLASHVVTQLQLMEAVVKHNDKGVIERIPHLRRVFVMDASWDMNYHHLLVESAPRLVRALPFLHSHPKVYIHMREEEMLVNPVSVKKHREGVCMRHGILELLGLSPTRIISGPVLADFVLMPHDQGCSNFLEHPYELRKLAGMLQSASENVSCTSPVIPSTVQLSSTRSHQVKKNIVVHNRPCSKNTTSYIWRCFTDTSLRKLGSATREAFPEHNIFVHPHAQPSVTENSNTSGDGDGDGDGCSNCRDQIACDIQQARETDIFIGLHGAAMTNVLFMRPGSLLVEVVGFFDGKMLPVCGIYGPLAAVFGVHHYIYYYDGLYDIDDGRSGGLNSSTEGLLDMNRMMNSVRNYYDALF